MVAKSVIDYSLGVVVLFLAIPLMLVIGLAIWLFHGGPVLDCYKAIGLRGRQFLTIKFHTGLLNNTRRSLGLPLSCEPFAERSTPVGAFLYRTGLDKLPQLWNVLLGDMSLVGPRIIPTSNLGGYNRWLPDLLTVKPGVTGNWAVNHYAGLEDELRGTLYYIRNWSPAEDITIFARTALAIFRPRRRHTISIAPPKASETIQPELDSSLAGR